MAMEIGAEYASSLADLTVNSKPLINMLTILAEENQEHAAVIVSAIETHLEEVRPDIKLPVLYLVDSICKNVGGAYTQHFAKSIVNMFTSTFKQVDERTRSQMFKLRETWNEIFPSGKLFQLDVKVNLVDPAWPIESHPPRTQPPAQQQPPVIHLNPHFHKKSTAAATVAPAASAAAASAASGDHEQAILSELARKQRELLVLRRKKIEMELEAKRHQLAHNKQVAVVRSEGSVLPPTSTEAKISVQARLGPPVSSRSSTSASSVVLSGAGGARITPVTSAMLAGAARRADPRLARRTAAPHAPSPPPAAPQPPVAPDVFDIKPLESSDKVAKRKNILTIDVRPELGAKVSDKPRDPRARRDPRDPRLDKRRNRPERKTEPELLVRDPESKHKNKLLSNSLKLGPSTFPVVTTKDVNRLPPIPRIAKAKTIDMSPSKVNESSVEVPSPSKRKKEAPISPRVNKKSRRREGKASSSSPEKSSRNGPKESRLKPEVPPPAEMEMETKMEEAEKEKDAEASERKEPSDDELVTFKELKNSTRDRNYIRRNREKSESPEKEVESAASPDNKCDAPPPPAAPAAPAAHPADPATVPDVLMDENKDVDLRVFPAVVLEPSLAHAAAPVARKRPSTEADCKPCKKNKSDKFDILFGNEDVDLRTLPQMEEAPPPPSMRMDSPVGSPVSPPAPASPPHSPPKQKSWAKVKVAQAVAPDEKTSPSQLDLVRAKFAEVTKGKDRLGRPLLYNKEDATGRRRTISTSEDTDMRFASGEMDSETERESMYVIMSQVQEQLNNGNMNPEQINQLLMQVFQLNERLKLKEAKERESLEASKRKLNQLSTRAGDDPEAPKKRSPNHVGVSSFGDIDERIVPPSLRVPREQLDPPGINHTGPGAMDSDLRVPPIAPYPDDAPPHLAFPPRANSHPVQPVFRGSYQPMWNGPRARDEFGAPRGARMRGPAPFFRNPRMAVRARPPFEARMPMPPPPVHGCSQGECPLSPYVRATSPPPLGSLDLEVPPPDFALLEYIERDPMKSIDIDGVPREIRFYGRTAIVMLDWDDPREITFLPGQRRISFDGTDFFMLGFNEEDLKVNVSGELLKLGYGRPTRELYVDDKWYECFFGGPPIGVIVNGKVMLVQLAGPPPPVDIGKQKRTDIVAGKINMIVDATTMCPVFLDAKPQKVEFDGQVLTIRFVDSLQTVLINEKPYKVEYGGLPKPIIINNNKHFIRFSVLPRNVRPGQVSILNMEGRQPQSLAQLQFPTNATIMEQDHPVHTENNMDLNPEGENSNQGLDMLASLMPSSMAPASQSAGYSVAEPLQASEPGRIPGLDTPADEKAPTATGLPFFGSINVNDLFAKLVATGIVSQAKPEPKEELEKKVEEYEPTKPEAKRITPEKPPKQENKAIKRVDLLRPATLRVKQPAVVAQLYGGMQCSGCGARFPPEQTVRYSQHLDWHFRQNRRERDSARRAHSRNWHYDLSDWIQYEEIEDLEEREKSWFESQDGEGGEGGEAGAPAAGAAGAEHEALSVAAGAPADAACALCGDKFDQFYNQDKEEWHLRRAVRHDDNNYHPLCFDDYKASLAKAEAPIDDSVIEVVNADDEHKKDPTDRTKSEADGDEDVQEVIGSDSESVVEVVESESQSEVLSQDEEAEPTAESAAAAAASDDNAAMVPAAVAVEEEAAQLVEDVEEDEDDVVLKAEPLVQVDVQDDDDTDDETSAARAERDQLYRIASVRIKQEPIDPDDEPVITAETSAAAAAARVDTTRAAVTSSIDGNVQLVSTVPALALPAGGIRINISRPVQASEEPRVPDAEPEEDEEPPPPGEDPEEPEVLYALKPSLEGVQFERQTPVQRGIELSGLCSIM